MPKSKKLSLDNRGFNFNFHWRTGDKKQQEIYELAARIRVETNIDIKTQLISQLFTKAFDQGYKEGWSDNEEMTYNSYY